MRDDLKIDETESRLQGHEILEPIPAENRCGRRKVHSPSSDSHIIDSLHTQTNDQFRTSIHRSTKIFFNSLGKSRLKSEKQVLLSNCTEGEKIVSF